jgi:hypothetical protein
VDKTVYNQGIGIQPFLPGSKDSGGTIWYLVTKYRKNVESFSNQGEERRRVVRTNSLDSWRRFYEDDLKSGLAIFALSHFHDEAHSFGSIW